MKYLIPIMFVLASCTSVKSPIKTSAITNNATQTISSLSFPTLKAMSSTFSKTGWKSKTKGQVVDIAISQTKSTFLHGFESAKGSQVFMLKSNASENKKRSASYINSITDMSATSNLFQLNSPAIAVIKNHSNGTRAFHQIAIGNGNGKTLYVRNGIPTRFEQVYIPLKFNDGAYGILRVNFRGKLSDKEGYQQFLNYIDTIPIPRNTTPVKN